MTRPKTYMCKMQFTYDMITDLIGIEDTDNVWVKDTYRDPSREIVTFVLESHEQYVDGRTYRLFQAGEGHEIPNQLIPMDKYIEAMRKKVAAWDEMKAKEND